MALKCDGIRYSLGSKLIWLLKYAANMSGRRICVNDAGTTEVEFLKVSADTSAFVSDVMAFFCLSSRTVGVPGAGEFNVAL